MLGQILRQLGFLLGHGRAGEDRVIQLVRDLGGVGQRGDAVHEVALALLQRPEGEVVVPQKERGAEGRIDGQLGLLRCVGECGEEGLLKILLRVLFALDAFPALAAHNALLLTGGGEKRAGQLLGGDRTFLRNSKQLLRRVLRTGGQQA